ncbi:MAG: ABC transporter ATP-binding protein [Aquihabitans sp.]
MVTGLEVSGVTVDYGSIIAVDDVSLAIAPGEIVGLVGPSGCGKSTLLRVVAGLEHGRGRVRWNGEDLTAVPTDRRSFGLMFQDHALFPHRSVAENVGFGLRMSGVGAADRRRRTDEVLDLVGLPGYGGRSIDTLSGGEAQRVALARAVAPSPRVLMLDEPLGSLDRSLRDRLTGDLRAVLREVGITAIHVTHDQEEAYAVADRLVVMQAGRVVRDGPAAEVWADPRSTFVAEFLGHRNVLDAQTAVALGLGDGPVVVRESAISIVPARRDDGDGHGGVEEGMAGPLDARVVDVQFRGATSLVTLTVDLEPGRDGAERSIHLYVHRDRPPDRGDRLRISIARRDVAPLTD